MESVTAVRCVKSAVLREGLGARIDGRTPEEGRTCDLSRLIYTCLFNQAVGRSFQASVN